MERTGDKSAGPWVKPLFCGRETRDSLGKPDRGAVKRAADMKRTGILLVLFLVLTYQVGEGADNPEFPGWVHELRSVAARAFQAEVAVSHVKVPDNVDGGKHFSVCLKGSGRLAKIPDPFQAMERIFSAGNWTYNGRYQADGHGSSSFAYEKGGRLCRVHVAIDSSCDDEETGHVPSRFWFEICCRGE